MMFLFWYLLWILWTFASFTTEVILVGVSSVEIYGSLLVNESQMAGRLLVVQVVSKNLANIRTGHY